MGGLSTAWTKCYNTSFLPSTQCRDFPNQEIKNILPFSVWCTLQYLISVYALGKQVDNGFRPNYYFENEIQA